MRHLLQESDGQQYAPVDLTIDQDFPLGFARSTGEFYRLLEHLLAEYSVRLDRPDDTSGNWVAGVRAKLLWGTAHSNRQAAALAASPLPTGILTVLPPQLRQVAESLVTGGHYQQAVIEGYIALIQAVKQTTTRPDLDGSALMDTVFSPRTPVLRVADDPSASSKASCCCSRGPFGMCVTRRRQHRAA